MEQEKRTDTQSAENSTPVQPQVDPTPITPSTSEQSGAAPTQQKAPPQTKSFTSAKKKPSGASSASKSGGGKASPAKKKSAKATSRTNSNKNTDDQYVHFTTATGSSPKKGAPKKEQVNLDLPRSSKPAHRVIPYVLLMLAVFVGICLLLNLFCNRGNKLADNPSAHWMGSVGYSICYWLFGLFGPAIFVLPLLLINLSAYWKKYIDNRLAISKITASVVFLILFGAVIHTISFSVWNASERYLTASQLIDLGSQMTYGGLLGGGLGYFLAKYLNIAGAIIVGICLLAFTLFYLLGMTPHHLWSYIRMRRNAKREGRGTISEQDAQAAGLDAKMQEKLRKTASKQGSDMFDETDDNGAPIGAVVTKGTPDAADVKADKREKPVRNREKEKEDRLAPMPIPMLNPNEGKLFVPTDVNRKLAEARSAEEKQASPQAASAQASTPAQEPKPVNPAANKDGAIEPIFPKTERVARPVPKQERNFDLKNVFINFNDSKQGPQKQHSPVPPEVPMPGAKPAGARPVQAGAKPAQAAQGTAPKAPTAESARPVTASAAQRPTAQKPVGTSASAKQVKKPILREVKGGVQKEFGLSNEEFERMEAQNAPLPKTGAKPAAKPAAKAPASNTGNKKPAPIVNPAPKPKRYVFPPLTYLHAPEPMTQENREVIEASVNNLYTTLQSFRINIDDISYSCGPTVTRYELVPAAGVRVRSIVNLSDDISLAFAAKVRIEAPIPGKGAVGIEVPNKIRSNVFLRELIESKAFVEAPSKLTACLGQDVTGSPLLFDIAKMPHLLVAGATGMGKSVCINSIIMSLLYKAKPDEVKLILIDPKKVEFGIYKGIPHLLAPIVTAPKDAAGALQAAVEEMEARFELIQQVGVHDIKGYNKITEHDPDMPYMPQIVIIIDELADLMMTAPDEVETAICRLAQKARAAGMHIIIGTQRPSVDVVTGLIKSNIPSRIAFTVASQVDSRTILDLSGAEKLIGKGDMLFSPVGAMGFTRVQGAFVDEKEVENICEFIRATNGTATYDERFTNKMKEFSAQCGNKGKSGGDLSSLPEGGAKGDDAKYTDAVRIAVEEKKISTSLLQRKLEIGYSRAAKLIDRMQAEGIVSAPDGSKPRTILITPEEFIERFVDVPPAE